MKVAIDMARFAAWSMLTVFFCMLCWLAYAMRSVPERADGVLSGLDGVIARSSAMLDAINAPCTGFHGSVSCGTLAQLSQTEKNFGIVAGQTALQVKQSGQLISAAVDNLNLVGVHASGAVDRMGNTAESATKALDAARTTIAVTGEQAQQLADAARPVLSNAAKTEADVDAFVTAPELKDTLSNVRETSANVAAGSAEATVILRDARKEADALTAPKPWYKRVWSDALHVGELVWDFAR